ncbi:hypothetical protein Desaci_1805 [Desulfosporosinus acidiphilus SJ4]|uniref:Uncharacterized protein n=1 Tax=Desulfosporosinus acidiphilus (strain DSM 22704 / JCM 16185 / SJ4) TaxID=646529 RepID=I4D4R8_DESAJ|nr:hypothetical protein Desaci_1805 [Desulfosporosinus acidiphilus SJ4]
MGAFIEGKSTLLLRVFFCTFYRPGTAECLKEVETINFSHEMLNVLVKG